jgi:hypothetical protein
MGSPEERHANSSPKRIQYVHCALEQLATVSVNPASFLLDLIYLWISIIMHHPHPTFHLCFVNVPMFRLEGHFNTNEFDVRVPLDRSKEANSVHFTFAIYSIAILQKFVNLQFVSCGEKSHARVVSSLILQYFASFEDVALYSLQL